MKISVIALLLLCHFGCFAQKPLRDFYLKRSLKQDGQQFQFTVLDEDKHGIWVYQKDKYYHWYKAQNVISTQGGSSGTLLNGKFEAFYPNKQLARKGSFHKGLKHGKWLYWREDGTLFSSENWVNGVQRGQQKCYDTDGQEIELTRVKRNRVERRVGDSLLISRNNGKYEKITIYDDANQRKYCEERKNGRLHGKVSTYEDGKLVETVRYKNGEQLVKEEKVKGGEKKNWFKSLFKRKDKDQSREKKNKPLRKRQEKPDE